MLASAFEEHRGNERTQFSNMQSWLNWYSIGLENRHSARISGFESQALRFALLAQLVEHLTFNQRVGSSSLLRGIMHEWRSWYTHRNKAPASKDMWVRSTLRFGRRKAEAPRTSCAPPRVLFNVLERKGNNGRFRDQRKS